MGAGGPLETAQPPKYAANTMAAATQAFLPVISAPTRPCCECWFSCQIKRLDQ
jgi:hypothetical protein